MTKLEQVTKKLNVCVGKLEKTRTRIKRLMTAQSNWEKRVRYYQGVVEKERKTMIDNYAKGVVGRKFKELD